MRTAKLPVKLPPVPRRLRPEIPRYFAVTPAFLAAGTHRVLARELHAQRHRGPRVAADLHAAVRRAHARAFATGEPAAPAVAFFGPRGMYMPGRGRRSSGMPRPSATVSASILAGLRGQGQGQGNGDAGSVAGRSARTAASGAAASVTAASVTTASRVSLSARSASAADGCHADA